jgi:hypothetical protein
MRHTVEIDAEEIVATEMRELYETFIDYLKQDKTNIFHFEDMPQERIALAQHAEAARLIHNYFCLASERIGE